jgi:CheY-like chemotaxis protein
LRLRVVSSRAWVRSDFILLERILLNLVSNAVRCTERGGVVVGCRARNGRLRIDVCDSGIGIPGEAQRDIFGEFYQLDGDGRNRHSGLGLGLAIVDRLCGLLDHPIELASVVGRGSRFSVSVPVIHPRAEAAEPPETARAAVDAERGKLVVVVDDDELVRDGTRGLLQSWGCMVVTGQSERAVAAELAHCEMAPDLIISDYRLAHGKTGFELINRLRSMYGAGIPAFLISGDTAPERLREAAAHGYYLLHKPVMPITLRSVVSQLLKDTDHGSSPPGTASGPEPATRAPAAAATPTPPPQ